MRKLRPKALVDITFESKNGRVDSFISLKNRINFSYKSNFYSKIPFKAMVQGIFLVGAVIFLIFGSVTAPTTSTLAANESANAQAERAELEAQLKELEDQIDQYEGQIQSYQKQGKSLKGEISNLGNKIDKLKLQVRAINLTLSQLDRKIDETNYQITTTVKSIDSNKESLGELIRTLYHSGQLSTMEILLKNPKISDFFDDLNSITLLQNSIQEAIGKITNLQNQLVDQKEQLSLARADAATMKEFQEAQRVESEKIRVQKDQLIKVTKAQEDKYQVLLKETKKTAAEIRSRIFQLLGGGELTFEKAYELAKMASDATGVDAAFILAVLDRESALGKNVGRCTYQQAMHPTRDVPPFLEITKELGLNPETMSVSCANSDGAYGGAMGPAQFIPSTWIAYKDRIAKATGKNPPSPWGNVEAFTATGLYLSDAMSGCNNLYTNQSSRERCAAAKYYAGGRWKNFLWTYGEATVTRANKFRDDIATITGN
jgi:peptidoglycan hydrolase CwlO-like protein